MALHEAGCAELVEQLPVRLLQFSGAAGSSCSSNHTSWNALSDGSTR